MTVSVLDLAMLTLRVSRKIHESAALSASEARAVADHIDAQQSEIARLRKIMRIRMNDADWDLAELDAEVKALKHDIGEYQKIVKDLTNENERLRAAVEALVSIVQRDRVAMYLAHRLPSGMVADDDGKRGLAEYDAALRLADAALGNDTERAE